jgi:hypothetical protein
MKKRFLRFAAAIVTLSIFVSCCSKPQGFVEGSSVFRLKYHEGFYGTHAPSYASLQFKTEGRWRDLWKRVYELGGTWDDKVLFLAATTESDASERKFRLLFYQPKIGIVDVNDELAVEKTKLMMENKIAESSPGKKWQFPQDGIIMGFETSPPSEIKVTLTQLVEMAERVKARNQKTVFDGNEFYR